MGKRKKKKGRPPMLVTGLDWVAYTEVEAEAKERGLYIYIDQGPEKRWAIFSLATGKQVAEFQPRRMRLSVDGMEGDVVARDWRWALRQVKRLHRPIISKPRRF